jgi:hypothetical protein
MGVLSDLVVAPDGDAERIARADAPARDFGGLGTLHSILTGRSFEELLSEYDPVVMVSDDGPCVFRIPPDLVTRLATLVGEDQQRAMSTWAATEEFALSGWTVAEVAEAFDGIASLARKAEASGQALFLWMSL